MRHERPSAGTPGQGRGAANRAVYGEEWEARLAQARAERARIQALKRAAMIPSEPADEPTFGFLPDAMPDLIDENDLLNGNAPGAPVSSPAPAVALHPGLRVEPEGVAETPVAAVDDAMPELAFVPPATVPVNAAGIAASGAAMAATPEPEPKAKPARAAAPLEQARPHPVLDPALDAPRPTYDPAPEPPAAAAPQVLDVPIYMPRRLHLSEVRKRRRGLWAARGVAAAAIALIVAAYAAPADAPARLASFVSSVTDRVLAPAPTVVAAPESVAEPAPVATAAVAVPQPAPQPVVTLSPPVAPRTSAPIALPMPVAPAALTLPGPELGDTLLVTAAPVAPAATPAALAFTPPAALPPEPAPQPEPVAVVTRTPAPVSAAPQPPAPAEAAAILRSIATSVAAERLTVFLQVPFGAPEAAATALFLQLNGAGIAVERPFRMQFATDQHQVRYYHAEDATLATGLAQAIGGTARDFSDVRLAPPVGTVEVWMAGGPQG